MYIYTHNIATESQYMYMYTYMYMYDHTQGSIYNILAHSYGFTCQLLFWGSSYRNSNTLT